MTTNCTRIRLVSLMVIALVAAGVVAAAYYRDCKQKTRYAEASAATTDHLYNALQFCSALNLIRQGEVSTVARRMDIAFCDEIVAINGELATASEGDQAFIKNAFARLALLRPKAAELFPDASLCANEIEAERILQEATAQMNPATQGAMMSAGTALPQR